MVRLYLPHIQVAEIGAKFYVKGGTTGGWKSKHWKCQKTCNKKKKSHAKPTPGFHKSQLQLAEAELYFPVQESLPLTTWGSDTNLHVFQLCAPTADRRPHCVGGIQLHSGSEKG